MQKQRGRLHRLQTHHNIILYRLKQQWNPEWAWQLNELPWMGTLNWKWFRVTTVLRIYFKPWNGGDSGYWDEGTWQT